MSKRSTSFPARWMSTYEALRGIPAQRVSLGHELAAFPDRCSRPHRPRRHSRSARARLSSARPLPTHRFFLRRQSCRQGISRLRPHGHIVLHGEHRNPVDPFILYCAIPQLLRGWELESHFRIPIYGWLMKRFGNVPVPSVRSPRDLKRLWRLTQEAINSGVSLIVFPEAKRTRDGHVNDFEEGGFRLAQQLGVPIVPVSLVGSFRHPPSPSISTTP